MGRNQFTDSNMAHITIPNVCGVYLLEDTVTGATYVGSSKAVRSRISQHFHGMRTAPDLATYRIFSQTYAQHGARAFTAKILQECPADELVKVEAGWISRLRPTENRYLCDDGRVVYFEDAAKRKARAAVLLWANPAYRERAVNARKGKAYNKGYKCTPEQVLNRRKAARISNTKRKFGEEWRAHYVVLYPDHAGDLDAK